MGQRQRVRNDFFETPYSDGKTTASDQMAGIFVHANIASQMLSAALDGRVLLRPWVWWLKGLWILLISLAGAAISWMLPRTTLGAMRLFFVWLILNFLLTGGVVIVAGYFAFLQGWWIPVVSPLVALTSGPALRGVWCSNWFGLGSSYGFVAVNCECFAQCLEVFLQPVS
ncbi:MAG: CHASE2 domain-containing protein [Oscillatoriales cyanobacterium RM1_1_9]|nr:CHASE2 domain-containing protein [Oscillatoriales cyanobacterium RM1_1_9]